MKSEIKTSYTNVGNKPIGNGHTVQVDHNVTTFVVSVRSMTNVGPETIKDLIQKKFEVTDIRQVSQDFAVKRL